MRALSWIAIAAISMWMTGEINAQKTGTGESSGQQVQGQESANGQPAQSRRGNRRRAGKGGSGMQQQRGQGQAQGKRGRRSGAQVLDFIFKRFDTNKDGKLTQQEAPDRMKQRFDMYDANGDKSVSKEEMQAAFAKMEQRRGQGGKKGEGKGKGKNGGGKGNRNNIDPAQMMRQLDKNKDGLLSPDETPDRMKKNFDRIDADSSGTISTGELKAMIGKMKDGKKQIGRDKSADAKATKPVKPKRPPMVQDGA